MHALYVEPPAVRKRISACVYHRSPVVLGESQNCEPGVAIHYTLALCYWAGHFTHHFSKRCLNNACCLEVGHHFLGARATVSTNKHRGKALQHGRACAQGMPAQNLTCMILYSVYCFCYQFVVHPRVHFTTRHHGKYASIGRVPILHVP
jgi:hypothetical protein